MTTFFQRARSALCIGLALLPAACATAPTPTPSPVVTIAEAPSIDGAALWPTDDGLVAAWVGVDGADVFQTAQRVGDATAVVLPLPPTHPFAQQAIPADDGFLHLLWLDAGDDDRNHLYTALLTPDLTVDRGPSSVSDDAFTQRYAAAPAPDGGVFVAWSGGLAAEPSLYSQRIDFAGRPLAAKRVAIDAGWPALALMAGTPHLFWLDRTSGELWRAQFDGSAAARLASAVRLNPGDRISTVGAAADVTRAAFVWNVTRADGSDESWLSAGPLAADDWPAPVRLALDDGDDAPPARWLAFAPGGDATVAAAQVGGQVGLLTLDGARVTAFTPLATLRADLIGPLRLVTLADGRYAVSWAEPGPARARLNVAYSE